MPTKPPLAARAGRRIQELRQIRDWTQAELGRRCGISQKYISAVEGGGKNLQLDTLEKIAGGLGVEPFMLLIPAPHRQLPDPKAAEHRIEGMLKTADERSRAFLLAVMETFTAYNAKK